MFSEHLLQCKKIIGGRILIFRLNKHMLACGYCILNTLLGCFHLFLVIFTLHSMKMFVSSTFDTMKKFMSGRLLSFQLDEHTGKWLPRSKFLLLGCFNLFLVTFKRSIKSISILIDWHEKTPKRNQSFFHQKCHTLLLLRNSMHYYN